VNKSTSLYLDFLRVVAAFGVLLTHVNLPVFSNNLFFGYEIGHKLVMVFFVLSGYLIAFTVYNKHKDSKKYLVDRFSRLYSVVLPALVFTYLIDAIGKYYYPTVYFTEIAHNNQFFRFVVNATYLQEIWNFSIKPSTNGPFWSISYEFWFYMLFWAFSYFTGKRRYLALGLLSLIVGFKILLLFPAWIFGVIAYNYANKVVLKKSTAIIIFLSSAICVVLMTVLLDFSVLNNTFKLGHPPLFYSSEFIFDWIYGLLIAVNLFSVSFISFKVTMPSVFKSAIKYLSSVTFTLYLFHYPLLVFIGASLHYDKSSYLQVSLLLAGIVVIVCILAALTEKQRDYWKRLFNKIFGWQNKRVSV